MENRCTDIQRHLDRPEKWAEKLIKSNKRECKILHLQKSNLRPQCMLQDYMELKSNY